MAPTIKIEQKRNLQLCENFPGFLLEGCLSVLF